MPLFVGLFMLGMTITLYIYVDTDTLLSEPHIYQTYLDKNHNDACEIDKALYSVGPDHCTHAALHLYNEISPICYRTRSMNHIKVPVQYMQAIYGQIEAC